VQPSKPLASPQPEEPKPSGGFLDSLKQTFLPKNPNPSPSPEAGSTGSSTEAPVLTPEVEKQLNRIPDVVGGDSDDDEMAGQGIGADEISALLDAVAFEEQDVKDTLEELFEWLAEHFEAEHWKLTPRQVRMLGRPACQLMNSLWDKLKLRIPDIIARWCESTPGATAFLMAFGLVVVPKGLKQWKLSRASAEGKKSPENKESSADVPKKQPVPMRSVETDSLNVPVATGTIGGGN